MPSRHHSLGPTSRLLSSGFYALVFAVYFLAVSLPNAHGDKTGPVAFSPCHIDGIEAQAKCAWLTLPLDWSQPDGDTFALHVAVVPPSGGQASGAPLYVLAGGPGQAASDLGSIVDGAMIDARRGREVILVDQRGTGRTLPFGCDFPTNPETSGADTARTCLAKTSNNPAHFGTDSFVDDLHAVRNLLGHDTINIWGGSYGTRAALLYLRKYEHTVRSVILDAVAPPSVAFMARGKESANLALQRMLSNCAGDAACTEAFPTLRGDLTDIVTTLSTTPHRVTFGDTAVSVDENIFLDSLRNAFYVRGNTSWLPYVITQFAAGNIAPWRAMANASGQLYNNLSIGTMLSVMCGEEVPRSVVDQGEPGMFAVTRLDFWQAACATWPAAHVPAGFADAVTSDVPTLLLSGALDPVTPPEFADIAAATLSRSRTIVAQHNSHITSGYSCVPRLLGEFLNHTDPTKLDDTCVNRIGPAPFLLTVAGPTP